MLYSSSCQLMPSCVNQKVQEPTKSLSLRQTHVHECMSARRRDAGCACGSSSRAHAQQSGISKEGSLSTHTRLIIDVIPALSLHVPHSRSTTALSRATAQQRHAQINDICAPGSTIQQCMCSLEHNPATLGCAPEGTIQRSTCNYVLPEVFNLLCLLVVSSLLAQV